MLKLELDPLLGEWLGLDGIKARMKLGCTQGEGLGCKVGLVLVNKLGMELGKILGLQLDCSVLVLASSLGIVLGE